MRKISKAEGSKVKRVNLNISVELHNRFKSLTAAQGENMTDVLLRFIDDYVREHTSPKPKGRRP